MEATGGALTTLVQTATGFNVDEGKAYSEYLGEKGDRKKNGEEEWKPRPLPMQALDHAAGYFLAFGVNVALSRMITEGGSWEVRVSLAAVGQWIRSLGRLSPHQAFGIGKPFPELGVPLQAELGGLSIEWREHKGDDGKGKGRKMTALRHAAVLSRTPVREGILGENEDVDDDDWGSPMRLGADGFEKACTRWEVETRNLREG
ncbi:hypothetical protein NLJ89_g11745 [Agrocybe chaxingu]|uniref:Uncharacterized protein n=1 Tax=Agrocybe chaxingu TaxID=84603 RepID=A0A9W8JPF1_9AGAR|nr:hypothetical protein NLJ89_g11745 [Agrocybe chaxingu]